MIGFSLLEVVNYLEHYGLLRQKREDGRYERCLPEHSWNSNNVASNVLLYHLQRHSDHHANPTRRYQALRHVDEAPQLPTGYAGMIVLAWFPPLWRRVMDPRLARPLRGRPDPGQHPAAGANAGSSPATGRRHRERLASVPACGYVYDEEAGHPREGFPAGDAVERGTRRLGLSRLRGPRQGRLRAATRVTAAAATMAAMAERAHPLPAGGPRAAARDACSAPRATSSSSGAWAEITMSDIAGAAGVSRQTLYKEFGSRDEFGQAFVIHEGERFLDAVEAAVHEHLDDPRAAVGAALELFLRTAGEDPLIRILLSDDGTGGMLPFVTTQGMPVVAWATARLDRGDPGGLAPSLRARRPAPRRVPGPPGDQLHHRPRRAPGSRPPPAAGKLLGPFIDRALGS